MKTKSMHKNCNNCGNKLKEKQTKIVLKTFLSFA